MEGNLEAINTYTQKYLYCSFHKESVSIKFKTAMKTPITGNISEQI